MDIIANSFRNSFLKFGVPCMRGQTSHIRWICTCLLCCSGPYTETLERGKEAAGVGQKGISRQSLCMLHGPCGEHSRGPATVTSCWGQEHMITEQTPGPRSEYGVVGSCGLSLVFWLSPGVSFLPASVALHCIVATWLTCLPLVDSACSHSPFVPWALQVYIDIEKAGVFNL